MASSDNGRIEQYIHLKYIPNIMRKMNPMNFRRKSLTDQKIEPEKFFKLILWNKLLDEQHFKIK